MMGPIGHPLASSSSLTCHLLPLVARRVRRMGARSGVERGRQWPGPRVGCAAAWSVAGGWLHVAARAKVGGGADGGR